MVNPAKNTICLWYDRDAEDAARFYAKTFPDSSVGAVHRPPKNDFYRRLARSYEVRRRAVALDREGPDCRFLERPIRKGISEA